MLPYKTKIFTVFYFLPAWIASLMSWGEVRTSEGFETAPAWFHAAKLGVQIGAILILFLPLKLRSRPPLSAIAVAFSLVLSTLLAEPVLEGDFQVLRSSVQIGILSVFLLVSKPSATFTLNDLRFLFALFLTGFILQIALYFFLGRMPSHSMRDVFLRFNGITNDSLSTGILLVILVPWAVVSACQLMKVSALIAMSALTGGLFGFIMVLTSALGYSLWRQLYRFTATLMAILMITFIILHEKLFLLLEIKVLSILTHMRFFLNLSNLNFEQPTVSCSEEFCESFLEIALHLSPVFGLLVYGLLFIFIVRLLRTKRGHNDIVCDSLVLFWIALFVASFVHPLPLIPFAIPLFLIFSILAASNLKRNTSFLVRCPNANQVDLPSTTA